MLPVAWYLLKVIICSGILYGYYWLLLRNKIFHGYNRFYLLATVLLSLLLPLLQISWWQSNAMSHNQVINVLQVVASGNEYMDEVVIHSGKQHWAIEQLYPLFYLFISFILLSVFIRTLYLIFSLLKKYSAEKIEGVSFVNTEHKSTPFSFLKYIFWNASIDLSTTQGRQIFKHEVAHIQEGHTYDKLFISGVLILCWCNPFFWLIRKELNMIHEFIADKKAVEDSDTAAFAAMILQATYPDHHFNVTNNFFYSPIKRRLLMLTKNKNPKANYNVRILVLPLAVLIFAAFTLKTTKPNAGLSILTTSGKIQVNLSDTLPKTVYVNTKKADVEYLKSTAFKEKALVILDGKELGNVGMNYVERNNIIYSGISTYNIQHGKESFGDKGKYGVIFLSKETLSVIIADTLIVDNENGKITLLGNHSKIEGDLSNKLILLDGKEITEIQLKQIKPYDIENISIIKGENATTFFDNKKAKHGVIEITTKPKNDLQEVVVIGYSTAIKPTAAISLDKMNVLYIGVDNPLTIAADIDPKDLAVTISEGKIFNADGKYHAFVNVEGKVTISLWKRSDEKIFQTFEFRVKRIPAPDPITGKIPIDFDIKTEGLPGIVRFDNFSGVRIPLDVLLRSKSLQCKNENYKVKSAEVYFSGAGFPNVVLVQLSSGDLSPLKTYIERCKAGSVVSFDNIRTGSSEGKLCTADGYSASVYENKTINTDDDKVFSKVEVDPAFPGGAQGWKDYLIKNIKAYLPVDEGWKTGSYTIIVQFIVHQDGTISDVTTTNYPGSKTAQHCIDIIKNGPKWLPAMQNGKNVNAYRKQPITFVVEEQEEIKKSGAEIYKLPLKVHLMQDGKMESYDMVSNGDPGQHKNVLYFVNGKIIKGQCSVKKEDVVSIESYDAASGSKVFGAKGKYGVILIKTKG